MHRILSAGHVHAVVAARCGLSERNSSAARLISVVWGAAYCEAVRHRIAPAIDEMVGPAATG